jgi:hypothetical protein
MYSMIRAPKPEDAAANQFHKRLERQIRDWFHPEDHVPTPLPHTGPGGE